MAASKVGELEQLILLVVLRLEDDAYGVTIQRELLSVAGRRVSFGAIYTTLDRLERKGYISSSIGGATAERGGRAKKFFTVEAPGKRALVQSLETVKRLAAGLDLPEEAS
jgi:PadR family transcriptional regulator PadR